MTEDDRIEFESDESSGTADPERTANEYPIGMPTLGLDKTQLDHMISDEGLPVDYGVGGGDDPIDDPNAGFPPTRVLDATVSPWRYVGVLQLRGLVSEGNKQFSRSYSTPAVVVGPSTLLTSAYGLVAYNTIKPGSGTFTPSYCGDLSQYGNWPLREWTVTSFILPTAWNGASTPMSANDYRNHYVFHDYALVKVASEYHTFRNNLKVTEKGTLADALSDKQSKSKGFVEIDTKLLPQNAEVGESINATCAGYFNEFQGGEAMYRQSARYVGSMIKQIPGEHGPTPPRFEIYQGHAIPRDANGLQLFSCDMPESTGMPFMQQAWIDDTWKVVGLRVAATGPAGRLSLSPTFSTTHFRDFIRRHAGGA